MGYIYKITNKLNQKVYIGKTTRKVEVRWQEHIRDTRHSYLPLQRAFTKYGLHSFEFEVLEEVENELLSIREQYYIKKFNSYENGYNATKGGDGGITHSLPQEEVAKIIEKWNQNKTITQIQKETGHCFRVIHSYILSMCDNEEQYLQKVKENLQKYYCNQKALQKQKEKIEQQENKFTKEEQELIFSMFELFYSCTYIAKQLKCSYKKLYSFLQLYYSQEEINYRGSIKSSLSKKYYKFSLEEVLIKIYNNREELKEDFSESQIKVIQNCARGVKKTAYGYKWKYEL